MEEYLGANLWQGTHHSAENSTQRRFSLAKTVLRWSFVAMCRTPAAISTVHFLASPDVHKVLATCTANKCSVI